MILFELSEQALTGVAKLANCSSLTDFASIVGIHFKTTSIPGIFFTQLFTAKFVVKVGRESLGKWMLERLNPLQQDLT